MFLQSLMARVNRHRRRQQIRVLVEQETLPSGGLSTQLLEDPEDRNPRDVSAVFKALRKIDTLPHLHPASRKRTQPASAVAVHVQADASGEPFLHTLLRLLKGRRKGNA